jgi:hypothetical protein
MAQAAKQTIRLSGLIRDPRVRTAFQRAEQISPDTPF